jgi:phosphate starvation-inducible PhoH-like protein
VSGQSVTLDLVLEPADNARLANLCGQFDENLRQIERRLAVTIGNRGNAFHLKGDASGVDSAARVLSELYGAAEGGAVSREQVHVALQGAVVEAGSPGASGTPRDRAATQPDLIQTPRHRIQPRGPNQKEYVAQLREMDLVFGVGPAGTGKTYLAVAAAVEALQAEDVRRIVLVRPAVEAGERLGFLPGDMAQKVDPYLRPMYDALYEMLGFERVGRLIDRHVIEVAPLAFMRGRTLNEAFIILDEAQNATREQMKMFLTRIGFGSSAVVTGDITQTDLPGNRESGLDHALRVLAGVEGVGFTHFSSRDVVRHPLVQRVVEAYERAEDAGPAPTP